MRREQFAPFVPSQDGPWDAQAAAHLLRRSGFGASKGEIEAAVAKGLEATVEDLFDDAAAQEAQFAETFERINGTFTDFGDPGQLQAWWCYRMMSTGTPLREKLTLFWHGHFATSIHKVENAYLMHRQIELLRQHAWGNFRDLVAGIGVDSAMLVYLDGDANTKEHPNENFARELMELFTVGIGNYTEKDVLEAARALTGWQRLSEANFQFNPELHDGGRKEFLGRRGRFKADDVIDILMQQPATPRFIARKLLVFFACPEPPDDVVAEAAELFARTRLNVKWFLRDLFQSKFFYSAACRRTRISSPAEFVIGTCRSLGVRMAAGELNENMKAMGQELFAPPNVKGWDGEKKWINSSALAARTAFAERLSQIASETPFGAHLDMNQIVPNDVTDPNQVVDALVDRLLDGSLPADTRREIATLLISNEQGPQMTDQFRADPGFREQQVRAALGLILSLPEFQTV
jgi:uncharacterized protein (DUF1800 family)